MASSAPIPTVLRIDVEPDEHQPPVGEHPWNGFLAMFEMVETLRYRLSDVTNHSVRPTWLIRLDPDIERAFGRSDFPVRRYHDLFDRILNHSDVLGIHVHALRWNAQKTVVFSDYADETWARECLRVGASSFQNCFERPPQVMSFGGFFMCDSLLDVAVDLGIRADVSVEPGLPPIHDNVSFGAYSTAPSANFVRCPRLPYYPSRKAFDMPATSVEDVRPLLMVPLISGDTSPILKRLYQRFVSREPPSSTSHSILGKSGQVRGGSGISRSGPSTRICPRPILPSLYAPTLQTPTRTSGSATCLSICHATQLRNGSALSIHCRRKSSRWPVRALSNGRRHPPVLELNECVDSGVSLSPLKSQ